MRALPVLSPDTTRTPPLASGNVAKLRLALGVFFLAAAAACTGLQATEQPIDFPHKSHTDNQIDCSFCHQYVDRQRAAGLPATDLCGTCHSAMPVDSPATQKLMEFVEAERPIPWVRLFELPHFNVFSHKRHIAAEVACETCHGDIGTSVAFERPPAFEMDWCVSCHEQSGASSDCLVCHK